MTDAPSAEVLVVERAGGVATLTLNRPKAMNSLSLELKEALLAALHEVAKDDTVRAVLLTGAGNAFCVGQDLKEHAATLASGEADPLHTVYEHYNPIVLAIAEMPKPVIAAVNGVAAGAGAAFAFAADFRIGGPGTAFFTAFANIGLAADSGSTWTLQRLVGYAKALELLMLPEVVRAPDAIAMGLLSLLVDDDQQVLPTAEELAAQLAIGPTVAYAQIKRCLALAASGTLAEALAAEAEAQDIAGATTDHRNATAAFMAKEDPVFTGR